MIRQFFRQALTMMRQQRLFTGMYLLGTAVSIALAMILFIIFYIKLGPIYPEYNRHRMLIVKDTKETVVNEISTTTMSSDISSKFASLIKKECSAVEEIALATISKNVIVAGNSFIDNEWGYEVNSEFWKVFNFKFIDGRPFTEDEKSEYVIIISQRLAHRLFAREDVVGETVNADKLPCRVIGVVEQTSGCSSITPTNGNYWLPADPENGPREEEEITGDYKAYITCTDREKALAEIQDVFNRKTQTLPEGTTVTMEIKKFWQQALDSDDETTLFEALAKYLYILLAFLFIPALNLSGMISSRMDGRMEEIGIRKAYGATDRQIVAQVLWENLLLTTMGAVIGLILSYAVVCSCDSWITTFFDTDIRNITNRTINVSMLFNPIVLGTTICITAVLNMTSALVPTTIALRKNIIESLYCRR